MKYLLLLCTLFFAGFIQGQNTALLQEIATHDSLAGASLSISVVDCETQNKVFNFDENRVVMPASVMKLVTSAAALELLGESFQFSTTVAYTGTITEDGILQGDVVIIGSGDPTLGSNYLYKESQQTNFINEIVDELDKLGIQAVTGSIAYTSSDHIDEIVPQGWVWEDLGNYYGAGVHDLNAFDNTVVLTFRTPPYAGGETQIIGMKPKIPFISIDNHVLSSNINRDRAYVYGDPNTFQRTIRGTLPKGRSAFPIKASIPEPGAVIASMFSDAMSKRGIENSGAMKKLNSITKYTEIFQLKSPRLVEIVEQLNEHSVNLFAEALCREVGAQYAGERSTSSGAAYISKFWREKANVNTGLFMEDGSGLSRMNGLSAKALTSMLVYMESKSKHEAAFTASIPVMGMEGTMRYYFKNSPLKGVGRAKSGSMSRVRSLSGYVKSDSGKMLAFTVMMNHYSCQSRTATGLMEDLLEAIVNDQ